MTLRIIGKQCRTHRTSIRLSDNYRWVGIYYVNEMEIAAIALDGQDAPSDPRFTVTKGLSGEVVSSHSPIISNDVENDSRYLSTLRNTQSEIIVPVSSLKTGAVIGSLDVESERKNAFTDADSKFSEECAREIIRLWEE